MHVLIKENVLNIHEVKFMSCITLLVNVLQQHMLLYIVSLYLIIAMLPYQKEKGILPSDLVPDLKFFRQ